MSRRPEGNAPMTTAQRVAKHRQRQTKAMQELEVKVDTLESRLQEIHNLQAEIRFAYEPSTYFIVRPDTGHLLEIPAFHLKGSGPLDYQVRYMGDYSRWQTLASAFGEEFLQQIPVSMSLSDTQMEMLDEMGHLDEHLSEGKLPVHLGGWVNLDPPFDPRTVASMVQKGLVEERQHPDAEGYLEWRLTPRGVMAAHARHTVDALNLGQDCVEESSAPTL
jgi:DNA-binding MarR family transcriptional regulator